MLKRPLLAVAVLTAAICAVLVFYFPYALLPDTETLLEDGDESPVFSEEDSSREGESPSGEGASSDSGTSSDALSLSEAASSREEFVCTVISIEKKTYGSYIFARKGTYEVLITAGSGTDTDLIALGSKIRAVCERSEWNRARNKGNYDEEKYYRSVGVFEKYELLEYTVCEEPRLSVPELMRKLRNLLIDSIESAASSGASRSESAAGILICIVTGSRAYIDDDINDLYKMSGIAHILAVSGLHISFVGLGLLKLLRKRLGPGLSSAIAATAVICYCLLCSGSVSSVRACVMFLTRILAGRLGRKYDLLSSVSLAFILLLAQNPFYLTNSGFLLSFSAVLSVYSGAFLSKTLLGAGGFKARGAFGAQKAFITFLSVTAGTLPIIVNVYFTYPLYGVLLNIIVLEVIPYVLSGALLGGIAGIFSKALGKIIIALPVYILDAIELLCRIFSRFPLSSVTAGKRSAANICVYYALFFAFLIAARLFGARGEENNRVISASAREMAPPPGGASAREVMPRPDGASAREMASPPGGASAGDGQKNKARKRCAFAAKRIAALLICFSILLSVITVRFGEKGSLRMIFFDVGQGECILIISPEGTVIMADSGSSSISEVYRYRVKSALLYMGISRIDYFLVTHPDEDHVSGLLEMLEEDGALLPETILSADFEGNENYAEILSLSESRETRVVLLSGGMKITENELEISYINSDINSELRGAGAADTNEMSAVFSVTYGEFCALITGDIDSATEKKLLKEGLIPEDINILDVAHHGSKNSSCEEFLETVSAEVAVVSAGIDNIYGHPAKETLERLEKAGATVLSTQTCGEIDITASPDGSYSIETMLEGNISS